jgi:hypothetical protein
MKVIVFTGPTLSPREVVEIIDATCLPPVSQGDVYRAVADCPAAIGIIDGYFERVPAVWHKEILWAMSEGVHVFGSASMGALRAAELVSFGMVGVGAIFEAYRDGVLEDDDEVALVHGRPEDDYRAGSDPMVNIRATLARAGAEGILGGPARALLQRTAKELFYPERSYARILELAAARGAPPAELEAFRRWLPEGAVNQKRGDALAMLRAMREFLATDPGPKCVSYVFEDTMHWEVLRRSAGEVMPEPQSGADALVLDQLRRDPEALERARAGALGWWLAAGRARREGYSIDAVARLDQAAEFCRVHGLSGSADVARWLESNQCGRERLESILESHALAAREENRGGAGLENYLLDYLRWTGSYAALLERVRSLKPSSPSRRRRSAKHP